MDPATQNLRCVREVLAALSSLAFFAAMTILSLFFLLKDGPVIRNWTERHIGVPAPVARIDLGILREGAIRKESQCEECEGRVPHGDLPLRERLIG